MGFVNRLQTYLRHAAQTSYDVVPIPPFTAFFHRTDDLTFFNYAIPDKNVTGDVTAALQDLRAAFRVRKRRPRWEYLDEFAPDLASTLRSAGFMEEARLHLMICTPATVVPTASIPGLEIVEVTSQSPRQDIYDYMLAQRQGFNPAYSERPTDDDIQQFRDGGGGNAHFVARIDGEAASAGGFGSPYDGISEIVGIATRAHFRRRGIASALTAFATQTAFERGVEIACLTAGDERAGRVYERIGYQSAATTLFYIDPEDDQCYSKRTL